MTDLTNVDSHFEFGANWKAFVDVVDPARLDAATTSLAGLVPAGSLEGKSFLDIGCGSGLSLLAAQRLGASELYGIDIDPNSVEAAQRLLATHSPQNRFDLRVRSVFDLDPGEQTFDVVHSWGVLHHTGSMWPAVARACDMVRPGGMLILALYKLTPFCDLWRTEKRLYTNAPKFAQRAARAAYKAAWIGSKLIRGQRPFQQIREYKVGRGMSWSHDIHDWLGGYPYESASPEQVTAALNAKGFEVVRSNILAPGYGLLGTGCDEFVARKSHRE